MDQEIEQHSDQKPNYVQLLLPFGALAAVALVLVIVWSTFDDETTAPTVPEPREPALLSDEATLELKRMLAEEGAIDRGADLYVTYEDDRPPRRVNDEERAEVIEDAARAGALSSEEQSAMPASGDAQYNDPEAGLFEPVAAPVDALPTDETVGVGVTRVSDINAVIKAYLDAGTESDASFEYTGDVSMGYVEGVTDAKEIVSRTIEGSVLHVDSAGQYLFVYDHGLQLEYTVYTDPASSYVSLNGQRASVRSLDPGDIVRVTGSGPSDGLDIEAEAIDFIAPATDIIGL